MELWRHPASLCIILRADISSHRCRLVTPAVTRFSQLRSQLQLLTEPWAGSQYHTTIWNSPASLLSHHGSSWSIFGHQIFRLRSFPDFAYMYVQLWINYVHVYKCPVSWTVPSSPGLLGSGGMVLPGSCPPSSVCVSPISAACKSVAAP